MDNTFLRKLGDYLMVSQGFQSDDNILLDGSYDPEMLYVECRTCGKPIIWEKGRTTHILRQSGIDPSTLDANCLILSDACKSCKPHAEGYHLSIVRLASISQQDLLLLQKHGGRA